MTAPQTTMTSRHRLPFSAVGLTVALLFCFSTVAVNAESLTVEQQEGKSLTAKYGDQILWQFHFDQEQAKPFFHPVAVPGGGTITWNSPPDHRWHHGLWFSWKFINGKNYWEPNSRTGKPDGRTQWRNVTSKTKADGSTEIGMQLDYRTGTDNAVLTEQRTITITAPDKDGSYHFDWQCKFTAGSQEVVLDRTPLPHEPGGQVYGGYAGLSVRMAKELVNRQATTNQGPVTFTPESRYRGNAVVMDYTGDIGGKSLGVAICDHPQNLNHPSPWYAIRSNVMSYFSPAVICNAPHTLKPGEQFTLRYRVIIHRDKWDAKRLNREYKQYVGQDAQ